MPVNAAVHDAPAGVFAAEHGVKVTTPVVVFSEYVPSPATDIEVAVQFGGVWPEEHNRTELVVIVWPDTDVESLDSRFLVWAAPWMPDDVSATAVAGAGAVTDGV